MYYVGQMGTELKNWSVVGNICCQSCQGNKALFQHKRQVVIFVNGIMLGCSVISKNCWLEREVEKGTVKFRIFMNNVRVVILSVTGTFSLDLGSSQETIMFSQVTLLYYHCVLLIYTVYLFIWRFNTITHQYIPFFCFIMHLWSTTVQNAHDLYWCVQRVISTVELRGHRNQNHG